jgi:hypothetical protein
MGDDDGVDDFDQIQNLQEESKLEGSPFEEEERSSEVMSSALQDDIDKEVKGDIDTIEDQYHNLEELDQFGEGEDADSVKVIKTEVIELEPPAS